MVPHPRFQTPPKRKENLVSLVTYKYTPEQMPEAELRATFTARQHTLDYLVGEMHRHTDAKTLNSYLVTGPRGSGKTTLLRMLRLHIRDDAGLSKAWLPIAFPEEQFDVASVRDLLAAILKHLSDRGDQDAADWLQKVEAESDDAQSEQLAITGLTQVSHEEGRRFVLFVENLDHLFENTLIDDRMKGTLRRLLMTDPFMMIVGSVVHVFESLRRYDEAFFNYFCPVPLGRLGDEEVFDLLRRRAEFDGNRDFATQWPNLRSRVKTLSHLSGGNPRLILMLYELLSERRIATVLQQLHRLVDELTPLLKHELEVLPAQQQKVIHALMERGGTAQPTDLTKPTRMSLNAVTTQLRRLKEAQVLNLGGGGKGRPAFYTVPDPLFSIWYQMRYLRPQRRRIEVFVRIIEVWFDAEERLNTLKTITSQPGNTACNVVRETAATAEYYAADLAGTPYEQIACDLAVRQWLKAGDMQEAALVQAEFQGLKATDDETHLRLAYAGLGDWSIEHDDPQTARLALQQVAAHTTDPAILLKYGLVCLMCDQYKVACDTLGRVTELPDATKEQVATALIFRGSAKRSTGDTWGEIADYTTVIESPDTPKGAVVDALLLRGMAKGQGSDTQGAIADYTAVIEVPRSPKDRVADALVSRGLARQMSGDTKGAIVDFTAVIEIPDAPKEQVAKAFMNRGIANEAGGNTQDAIADFTVLIEQYNAPKEQVVHALLHRGLANRRNGDTQGEIADYTAMIELPNAPKELVVEALLRRGVAQGRNDDAQGAIADFTTVIELPDAPKEEVMEALFYRGLAKLMSGDTQGAITDFTAVIELPDAPKERVAMALINRGVAKRMAGDTLGAITDFSSVVGLPDVPKEQVAGALLNRGIAGKDAGRLEGAISDWTTVILMGDASLADRSDAAIRAFSASWHAGQTDRAKSILPLLAESLRSVGPEERSDCLVTLLSDLANPEMKEAWPHAWQVLTEHQPPDVTEAMKVFKPVSQVLEGADRSILDTLPPEERAFAERILQRFNPPPTGLRSG